MKYDKVFSHLLGSWNTTRFFLIYLDHEIQKGPSSFTWIMKYDKVYPRLLGSWNNTRSILIYLDHEIQQGLSSFTDGSWNMTRSILNFSYTWIMKFDNSTRSILIYLDHQKRQGLFSFTWSMKYNKVYPFSLINEFHVVVCLLRKANIQNWRESVWGSKFTSVRVRFPLLLGPLGRCFTE